MNWEKHKEIIKKFLDKRYGLDIGQWISLSEHLHRGYTFGENMDLIKEIIQDKIKEYPYEFFERMTPEAYGKLQFDLMEHDKPWRNLIITELGLREEDIE